MIFHRGPRPTLLNPLTAWRLRGRVNGGVEDGALAGAVIAKIGEPTSKKLGDNAAEEIWTYEVGAIRRRTYSYSLLIRDMIVAASWFEERLAKREQE